VPGGTVSDEFCGRCSWAGETAAPLAPAAAAAQIETLDSIAANSTLPNGRDAENWLAIAMISAPRRVRTVERSLQELRRGGFDQTIHVFQEPGTHVAPASRVQLHTNPRQRGMWGNWLQAAEFLLQHTTAEFLLLCEDDIELCPAAAERLRQGLAGFSPATFGLASLYTPLHNLPVVMPLTGGWHGFVLGRVNWGSLGYCFSRLSLRKLLSSQTFRRHTTS
jgi:hypothetical protein